MRLRITPSAFWMMENPFSPAHARRRASWAALARHPHLDEPDEPPYARLDATVLAALAAGTHAHTAHILSTTAWSWRDASAVRRLLVTDFHRSDPDVPGTAEELWWAFELIDALPLLEIDLAAHRRDWPAVAAVVRALRSVSDTELVWRLALCTDDAIGRHLRRGGALDALGWFAQIAPACALLDTPERQRRAFLLAPQLDVDPFTLAECVRAVE